VETKLKFLIWILITSILFSASVAAIEVLKVGIAYDNGELSIINSSKIDLEVLPDNSLDEALYLSALELNGTDNYVTISLESNSLPQYEIHIEYPILVYYDYPEGGGGVNVLNKSYDYYLFPYYNNSTTIAVYSSDNSLLDSFKLEKTPETGDEILPYQNKTEEIKLTEQEEDSNPIWVIFIAIAAVLIVMFIILGKGKLNF